MFSAQQYTEFLDAIRSVDPTGKWKILVVDEYSHKLLGSVLKQFDILEENVTCAYVAPRNFLLTDLPCFVVIESITNYRDPQPDFEALYLLMPTSQNVDRVIKDFTNGRQQYAAAHLFFIEGASLPTAVKGMIMTFNAQGCRNSYSSV